MNSLLTHDRLPELTAALKGIINAEGETCNNVIVKGECILTGKHAVRTWSKLGAAWSAALVNGQALKYILQSESLGSYSIDLSHLFIL